MKPLLSTMYINSIVVMFDTERVPCGYQRNESTLHNESTLSKCIEVLTMSVSPIKEGTM